MVKQCLIRTGPALSNDVTKCYRVTDRQSDGLQ